MNDNHFVFKIHNINKLTFGAQGQEVLQITLQFREVFYWHPDSNLEIF